MIRARKTLAVFLCVHWAALLPFADVVYSKKDQAQAIPEAPDTGASLSSDYYLYLINLIDRVGEIAVGFDMDVADTYNLLQTLQSGERSRSLLSHRLSSKAPGFTSALEHGGVSGQELAVLSDFLSTQVSGRPYSSFQSPLGPGADTLGDNPWDDPLVDIGDWILNNLASRLGISPWDILNFFDKLLPVIGQLLEVASIAGQILDFFSGLADLLNGGWKDIFKNILNSIKDHTRQTVDKMKLQAKRLTDVKGHTRKIAEHAWKILKDGVENRFGSEDYTYTKVEGPDPQVVNREIVEAMKLSGKDHDYVEALRGAKDWEPWMSRYVLYKSGAVTKNPDGSMQMGSRLNLFRVANMVEAQYQISRARQSAKLAYENSQSVIEQMRKHDPSTQRAMIDLKSQQLRVDSAILQLMATELFDKIEQEVANLDALSQEKSAATLNQDILKGVVKSIDLKKEIMVRLSELTPRRR